MALNSSPAFRSLNPKPCAAELFGTLRPPVELYFAMLNTKFQASEPSGSEEENFFVFSYVFLWFKPRIPWCGAILDPGTLVGTNLVKDH